ncbi:MAG: DUF481 domain-containing protein [Longimicrobiales bacterium]
MTRYTMTALVTRRILLLSVSLFVASPLLAQEEAPPAVEWSGTGEVGASVFFGASDQTTVAVALELNRQSPRFQWENDLSYLYGEASNDVGETFVNKRSWSLGTSLDYRSFSRVNPYVFGNVLSSLEKAIKSRFKGGVGARLTALDSEATKLSFGLAVLGERTVERDPDNGDSEFVARWATEAAYRHAFSGDRTVFEVKGNYSPAFDEIDNYTVTAESSITFKLSEIISLKLSVVDNYDSRATDRGALDNNDGRVLFSVLSAF